MKKIKLLLIPLFAVLFALILNACVCEYKITGDLDVLNITGYEVQIGSNGEKYFKIKPGTKFQFNINTDKLDKEKEVKQFQIKKGNKQNGIESGHTEVVDADIEFRVIYHNVEFVDVNVTANEALKQILSFKKLQNNDFVPLLVGEDYVKKNNFVRKIRKGLELGLEVDLNSNLLKGKQLKSITVNNQTYTDFTSLIKLGKVQSAIQINISIQDLTKLTPNFAQAIFQEFNVTLKNDLNSIYTGETLEFDFSQVKSFYKRKATGVKVNDKTYPLAQGSNNILVPLDITTSLLTISLSIENEEANPSKIFYNPNLNGYFSFKIKRGDQDKFEEVTDLTILNTLYQTDKVKVSTVDGYRNLEQNYRKTTTKFLINGKVIKEGRNTKLLDYEITISNIGERNEITIVEENLRESHIEFNNEFLEATYRNEIKTSPVDAYPFQKIVFKLIKNIPTGYVLEGLFYNNEKLPKISDNEYEFIIPEADSCKIELETGSDTDFVLITLDDYFAGDQQKRSTINNQIGTSHHIRKGTNAVLKLSSNLFQYDKILVAGNEVEVRNDHYEFVASDNITIKILQTSIISFRTKLNLIIGNLVNQFSLTNINIGENLINIGTIITIKPVNNTKLEFSKYYLNDEKKTVINGEITLTVDDSLEKIEIKSEDIFELCTITLDLSNLTNNGYLQLPQESFKKLGDKYLVRKNKTYVFLVTNPAIHYIYHYQLNSNTVVVKDKQFSIVFNDSDTLTLTNKDIVYIKGEFDVVTTSKIDYNWLITNLTDNSITATTALTFDVLGENSPAVYVSGSKACYFTKKGDALIYVSYDNIGYILKIKVNYQMNLKIKLNINSQFKNSIDVIEVGNKNVYKPIYEIEIQYYDIDNNHFKVETITDNARISEYITKNINFTIIDNSTNSPLIIIEDYEILNEQITFKKEFNSLKIYLTDTPTQVLNNIKVVSGYNAYDQRDIYNLFRDLTVDKILLQRNIKLKPNLTHEQTQGTHPDYSSSVYDQAIYGPLVPHSGEPMLKNNSQGSYFTRILTNDSSDFALNGNGFQIEAKDTPFPSIENGGWAIGGPNSVCDVNFGIFDTNFSTFNVPQAITTFTNIKLIGNTSLPDTEANPSSKVPAWASGGVHGLNITTRSKVDNTIISNCVLGIYSRHNELILSNSKFDDNWASSIMFSNSTTVMSNGEYRYNGFISQIKLDNNELHASGGPALFIIDWSRGRRGDTTEETILANEQIDPILRQQNALNYQLDLNNPESCSSYSYDPTIYIASNNTFENLVDGRSSWFVANKIPAANIIAQLTNVFKPLNAVGVHKSPINNSKQMNFAMFFQNSALTHKEKPDVIENMEEHVHQSFDIYLENNGHYDRTYRYSEYKKQAILAPLLTQGGVITGLGFDYAKALGEACQALGVDLNNLTTQEAIEKYKQAAGVSIIQSINGSSMIPFTEQPTYFSKKFFELHGDKLNPEIDMNAIPVLGLFDQNVPD